VAGRVLHPAFTPDLSSFLLQARGSGAKVIGLANAGIDTVNSLKQAREFGIGRDGKQKLAALLLTAIGEAGGLELFYRLRTSTAPSDPPHRVRAVARPRRQWTRTLVSLAQS